MPGRSTGSGAAGGGASCPGGGGAGAAGGGRSGPAVAERRARPGGPAARRRRLPAPRAARQGTSTGGGATSRAVPLVGAPSASCATGAGTADRRSERGADRAATAAGASGDVLAAGRASGGRGSFFGVSCRLIATDSETTKVSTPGDQQGQRPGLRDRPAGGLPTTLLGARCVVYDTRNRCYAPTPGPRRGPGRARLPPGRKTGTDKSVFKPGHERFQITTGTDDDQRFGLPVCAREHRAQPLDQDALRCGSRG